MKALWILLLVAGCSRSDSRPLVEEPPDDEVWLGSDQMARAHIEVAVAQEQQRRDEIVAAGRVAFDDLHVTHVYSPVTGRITRVLARPGDRVTKGQPLAALVSPDVGAAFADTVKAQADLQTTEIDLHREQRLLESDATTRRSFEAAEDAYRRAKAEYQRATQRAALLHGGSVDRVSQEVMLRSFIDGDVIARNTSLGMEVAGQYAGGTSPELFTIGDIKHVWLYADVADTDLPRVHVGDDIEATVVAYPARVFRGKVDYIAGTVDPVLRTARVRASFANDDEALKPEMFASVRILEGERKGLFVPRDAVVAINEGRYVFVAAGTRPDGRRVFRRRAVTIGAEHDGFVPVTSGLVPGEQIVVTGSVGRETPNDEVWPTAAQLAAAHITTVKVAAQDVPEAVSIGGRLTFDDTRISHVFSPVSGRVTRVLAELGQHVTRGTPLVAISSPDVATVMADLLKADADRVQAEHELARQKELVAAHIGAPRDLDAAEDAYQKAKAEYDRTKQLSELVHAADFNAVSQEYVLRSPIEGEVIARRANPGLEVQGQYSNGSNVVELFTIGDLDRMWVIGDLYDIDLAQVREGDDVTIRVAAYPNRTFHGRIEWISDVLDPQSHTARMRCVLDNPEHLLRPEMYESVDIRVPSKDIVAVPRDAVMRVEGKTIVFVETSERRPDGGVVFKRREIVARLDGNTPLVPVVSGLVPGETVAVAHSLMLLGML